MLFFRNFTVPIWEIFTGNLLLLICGLFYLAWWVVSGRPDLSGGSAGNIYIVLAFISGFAAIGLLSVGISSLSTDSKGLPLIFIIAGGTVLFLILLLLTSIVFHRIVTSELIIIHIWAVLELSAATVLYGTNRFGMGQTLALSVLIGIASVAGLICYMLYYNLDVMASYYVGMIPLITDAFVMTVFLVILAIS